MSNLKVIKLTRDANGNVIVTRDANGRVQVPTDARGWPLDDPWGEHPAGAHEYFPWQRAGLKEEDVCTIKPIADTEWRSDDSDDDDSDDDWSFSSDQ